MDLTSAQMSLVLDEANVKLIKAKYCNVSLTFIINNLIVDDLLSNKTVIGKISDNPVSIRIRLLTKKVNSIYDKYHILSLSAIIDSLIYYDLKG